MTTETTYDLFEKSYTEDGHEIVGGMRVFTYDMRWGTVVEVVRGSETDPNPWHTVRYDDGMERVYNGTRMAVRPSHDLRTRFPDVSLDPRTKL